ncbi:restriction endonuclease subunit S [Paraprevotella clara]|uniref:Type I restriction modification DNA specificity domain-containing protein n=1 Tax=Paraprevotella clara YIT 11840 TaxID=762968 RepID=G5SVK5_9BACT|nr:restriction endonuclease subunit S [Paraprevotella clara]EHG98660.1 hypothetical protein HMPREF9441_03422 [Paraprevotella clara YIT 11840]
MRFPEFSGEWKIVKVSELLEFYSTNSLSWEQLDYGNGIIKNLHYGLIHKGLPTMVDISSDLLPYIKSESMPKSYTLFLNGDVAFADASEDTNDVAKAVEIVNCDEQQIVSGLHTIHGRDKSDLTVIGYKGYAFASDSFHKQIRRIAQGTKVFSINVRNFDEVRVGIPSKDEQIKIAKLLRAIDLRIATQNKIIEDLKKLKSAIIDKLFDNLEGERCTYRELFQIVNDRNKDFHFNKVIAASQEYGMVERDTLNLKVQFDESSINTYKIIRTGDYVVYLRSFQGGFAFSELDGICSPAYIILRPNTRILSYGFLRYYFVSQPFINSLRLVTYGIRDGRSINVEEWMDMPISIPDKSIQDQILKTIQSIDNKLLNERHYLNSLLNERQFFLGNMFI